MMRVYYRPVCQLCGKPGTQRINGSLQGGPPRVMPIISGRCPCSPSGKHVPRWEME